MRILVTGATGFVGQAIRAQAPAGATLRLVVRQHQPRARSDGLEGEHGLTEEVTIADLTAPVDWAPLLEGVDAVIHLAARVHRLRDDASDPLAEYRAVNTVATTRLARAAAEAGIGHFVFVSTVKVHGEATAGEPLRPDSPIRPEDPYGRSKAEAEEALREIERSTGMGVTIVRPPLVYGPGVRANFLRLMDLVDRGFPLPFGRVENRRSLVYVRNLADLLLRLAMRDPLRAATFLVADGPAVSTPELVRAIATSLGKRPRLVPVPPSALRLAGSMTGRRAAIDRLLGSLEVDCSALADRLGWQAPTTFTEGMARTGEWYARTHRRPAKAW